MRIDSNPVERGLGLDGEIIWVLSQRDDRHPLNLKFGFDMGMKNEGPLAGPSERDPWNEIRTGT